MGKLSKIILSCACTVFAIAIIGFCVWKITYTPSAASSQNNSMDITDSETDSIKITAPDGSEFIIVNPPVPKSLSVSLFLLLSMAAGFLPGLPLWGDALPAALHIVLGIVSNNSKTTAFLTKTAVSRNGKRLLYIFLTVPSIAWMPLRGKSRTVPMLCR